MDTKVVTSIPVTPALLALLWRPQTGQGGMQTMIRRAQQEIGIPDTALRTISPSMMKPEHAIVVTMPNGAAPVKPMATTPKADSPIAPIVSDGSAVAQLEALLTQAAQERKELAERLAASDAILSRLTGSTATANGTTPAVSEPATDVHPPRKSRKRANAARRAWEALTPKQRKARIARMQAGRNR